MNVSSSLTIKEKPSAGVGFCYHLAIVVLVLVRILISTFPAYAQNETLGTIVVFGDDRYQFPRNARDFLPDRAGVVHDMSMRLIYPEMEGRTPNNSRSMSLPSQSNRSIQLLIMDDLIPGDKVVLTPQQSLNVQVWKGLTRQQYRNDTIEGLRGPSFDSILKDFNRVSIFDLDELILRPQVKIEPLDFIRRGMQRGERRFIKTNGKNANIFISCRSPKVSPNPNCNMWFGYRDIYVKANFVLALLPKWNDIRSKLVEYFERYRVKP